MIHYNTIHRTKDPGESLLLVPDILCEKHFRHLHVYRHRQVCRYRHVENPHVGVRIVRIEIAD